MRSRVRIALGALGLMAAAGLGCGSDGGSTGPSNSDLMGTWNATQVEIVSDVDQSQRIDVLGSSTFSLTFHQDHTWDALQTYPIGPPMTTHGTWSLTGRTLSITPDGGFAIDFKVTCDGNQMTMKQATTWDYDHDGNNEPATLRYRLTR